MSDGVNILKLITAKPSALVVYLNAWFDQVDEVVLQLLIIIREENFLIFFSEILR